MDRRPIIKFAYSTAKIVSYKPATNRAKVQPVGEFKTADERSLPYPEINSVPVIFPCGAGGKSGMTFPIKAGDSGLIIFAENQLTDFLTGSGDSASVTLDPVGTLQARL